MATKYFPSYLLFYNANLPFSYQKKESNPLPFESWLVLVTWLANIIWWLWLLRLPRLGHKKPCSFLLGFLECSIMGCFL